MREMLLVVLTVALAAGCEDPQAAQQAQFREDLAEALELVRQVHQGFVPPADKVDLKADPVAELAAFRRQKINGVIALLEPLAAGGAMTKERATAKQMLAEFYVARARDRMGTATSQWIQLLQDTSRLMRVLSNADRADQRAAEAELLDNVASEALAEIDQIRGDVAREQSDAQARLNTLNRKIADLDGQIKDLVKQKDQALLEASRLRQQAFTASGDEHDRLHEQADTAESHAAKAEIQTQRLELDLTIAHSARAIAGLRRKLADGDADNLADRTDKLDMARDESRQNAAAARQIQNELGEQMYATFEKINDQYNSRVEQVLAATTAEVDKAAKQCRGIRSARINLMIVHLASAQVLTRRVVIADSYARMLDIMARHAQRLVPPRADSLRNTALNTRAKQLELLEQAGPIREAARQDAGKDETAQQYLRDIEDSLYRAEQTQVDGASDTL